MNKDTNPVVIYSSPLCGYCAAAKRLLKNKGVEFTDIDVLFDKSRRNEMVTISNGRVTVPQIFIGDTHIGGCDDLYELERSGRLDEFLRNSAPCANH